MWTQYQPTSNPTVVRPHWGMIFLVRDDVRPNANAIGLRDGGGENPLPLKSHRGYTKKTRHLQAYFFCVSAREIEQEFLRSKNLPGDTQCHTESAPEAPYLLGGGERYQFSRVKHLG